MPETLICNLDPAWGFAHLCQCHGLDLYMDNDPAVWDAGAMDADAGGPLNWPRPLRIEEMHRSIEDLVHVPGECPKQVILIGGFQSVSDWNRISPAVNLLPTEVKRFLICSKERGPEVELPIDCTFMTSETDPHARFLIFRIIQEILQKDPELLLGRAPYPSPHCLEVNFSRSRTRMSDRVALDWPPVASWLEDKCISFLSSRNMHFEREAFDDQTEGYLAKTTALLNEEYFAKTPPEFRDTVPPEDGEDLESGFPVRTPAEAAKASLPKPPLFYKKEISAVIDGKCEKFYDDLTKYLRPLYRRCTEERDRWRKELRTSGEAVYRDLEERVTTAGLGYGQSSVHWLKQVIHRVDMDLIPDVETKLNECMEEMGDKDSARGNKHPDGVDGTKTHFKLMHFVEDDALDEAKKSASACAESLGGIRFFWIATLLALCLASLPGLARWKGGGAPLFSEIFDVPWVSLFGAVLVICMLAVCLYRQKRLRRSLDALKTALTEVNNRHVRAYCAIFEYLSAREAMERLQQLAGYCRNQLDEIEQGVAAARNLKAFLAQQLEYYRKTGFFSSPSDPAITDRNFGLSPQSWLKDALRPLHEKWARGEGTEIEIQGLPTSGPRVSFKSSYFKTAPLLIVHSTDRAS
ncbi:MAG: hypothetical protein ACOWYE_09845 [Desulfatiglandales bacterium]